MYLTGTQYNFPNRLHQLNDSLEAYASFDTEFSGYSFGANEEFKITKEQHKQLQILGEVTVVESVWDGGIISNPSFDDGITGWDTLYGWSNYHPNNGTSIAIASGTLYFTQELTRVYTATLLAPDLTSSTLLTASFKGQANPNVVGPSKVQMSVSLMNSSLIEVYLLTGANETLTTTPTVYEITLTKEDFESAVPGTNWTDIVYAIYNLDGDLESNEFGNVGPEVTDTSLIFS